MPGGFHAFEMLTASADEWLPGPEEQWLVDAKFEADKDTRLTIFHVSSC